MDPAFSHAKEACGPPFEIHAIEWNKEKIARYWDYVSTRPWYQQNYFSRLVGRSILAKARAMGVGLQGRILDFGCGLGYLLDLLIAQGVACEGCDSSERAIGMLTDRLKSNPLFQGVIQLQQFPSRLSADTYDVVFCIEIIEHLMDDDLEAVVTELRRILRPGGKLVITTPNEEDLDETEVFCPDCGCSFSRNQHIRSWSAASLIELMAARGFRQAQSRTTYFRPTPSGTVVYETVRRLRRRKLPNLIWVGQKD